MGCIGSKTTIGKIAFLGGRAGGRVGGGERQGMFAKGVCVWGGGASLHPKVRGAAAVEPDEVLGGFLEKSGEG